MQPEDEADPPVFCCRRNPAEHSRVLHCPCVSATVSVKTDQEEGTALQRQIDATDRQIDELVYEVYGLTEEERRIVEGSDK